MANIGKPVPLDVGIDEHVPLRNFTMGSQAACQVAEGFMPEPVLLRRRAQSESQLHEEIACPEKWMDLNEGGTIITKTTEGDPARKDVSLSGHEAE